MQHGLRALRLRSCGLGAKSVVLLMSAFMQRFAVSLTLEELDLSGNSLGTEGSAALGNWLSYCKDSSALRILSVSNANAVPSAICRALPALPHLTQLDFSHSKLSELADVQLLATVAELSRVTVWDLSGCALERSHLEVLLRSLSVHNTQLQQVHLNLSANNLDDEAAAAIAHILEQRCNLHTLNLSGIHLVHVIHVTGY
jgi:Ran GTPase-activating protein (RanGAP) involved in mRNA processing and transport